MQHSSIESVSGFTHYPPLGQIKSWFKFPSTQRLHKFRADEIDFAYIVESDDNEPGTFLMTAQRSGVKLGDCIELEQHRQTNEYRIYKIQKIDYYYPNKLGMWVARLIKVEN